jgi:hypothetical protein
MTRLRTVLLALNLVGLLWSCKSPRPVLTSTGNGAEKQRGNNVVTVDSDNNTNSRSNSKDEIIFEGANNLFELVQKKSAYFDQSHDIIIIKGSNTIVRLH